MMDTLGEEVQDLGKDVEWAFRRLKGVMRKYGVSGYDGTPLGLVLHNALESLDDASTFLVEANTLCAEPGD